MRIYISSPGERLSNVIRNIYGPNPTLLERLAELHQDCFMHSRTNPDILYPYQALYIPYADEFNRLLPHLSDHKTIVNALNSFTVDERIRLKEILKLEVDPQILTAVQETNESLNISEKLKEITKELTSQTIEQLTENGKHVEAKFRKFESDFYSAKTRPGIIGNKYTAMTLRSSFNEFTKEYYDRISLTIKKKLPKLRQLKKHYFRNPNTFILRNRVDIENIRRGINITTKINKAFTAWDIYGRGKKVWNKYSNGQDWERELTVQTAGFGFSKIGAAGGTYLGNSICVIIVAPSTFGIGAFACVVIASAVGSIAISTGAESLAGITYDHKQELLKILFDPRTGPIGLLF